MNSNCFVVTQTDTVTVYSNLSDTQSQTDCYSSHYLLTLKMMMEKYIQSIHVHIVYTGTTRTCIGCIPYVIRP